MYICIECFELPLEASPHCSKKSHEWANKQPIPPGLIAKLNDEQTYYESFYCHDCGSSGGCHWKTMEYGHRCVKGTIKYYKMKKNEKTSG